MVLVVAAAVVVLGAAALVPAVRVDAHLRERAREVVALVDVVAQVSFMKMISLATAPRTILRRGAIAAFLRVAREVAGFAMVVCRPLVHAVLPHGAVVPVVAVVDLCT